MCISCKGGNYSQEQILERIKYRKKLERVRASMERKARDKENNKE